MSNGHYTITNPDQVELKFQLAGMGSRFCAGLFDLFFMLLIMIVLLMGLLPFGEIRDLLKESENILSTVQGTVLILMAFVVYWGYHVFWETFSRGQSPGKKICQIQVLTDDGLLPSCKHAVIRNLIRTVDAFPGISYFVAGVAMGIDPNGKRLGDMAAGTIVVRKEHKKSMGGCALSARSMVQIEKGKKAEALMLPYGAVDPKTIALIHRFLMRREELTQEKRAEIALTIASPLYEKWGEKLEDAERFLEMIQTLANEAASKAVIEEVTIEKLELWNAFEKKVSVLLGKKNRLRKLTPDEIDSFIQSYRQIVVDLARSRSTKTERATLDYLNHLVILGHQLLYCNLDERKEKQRSFFLRFPELIRKKMGPLVLSTAMFFIPAIIAYCAVLNNPELGYDLVPDQFIDFHPAQADNIHNIPSITRPMAASGIITNNIQVTFLAFAFGLTAGLGTCYILIFNGVHLGSVAAWMQLNGNAYALWGWIMPHGATEILAIILSGAAGFILADAILRPGKLGVRNALKIAAKTALTIELGCMGMLIVAGLIEGFVSPSSITYVSRLAIFGGSILFWAFYFGVVKPIGITDKKV